MEKHPFTDFNIPAIGDGGFELIEIKKGWLDNRKVLDVPHRHIFHELIWLKKGPDFHTVDFENYQLKTNQVLFIPQNSIHDYKPNLNAAGWKLIFSESFFTSVQFNIIKDFLLFVPCLGNKVLQMNGEESEIMDSFIRLLNSITNPCYKQTLVVNLLTFIEDSYQKNIKVNDTVFIKFLKLLGENLYQHKNIPFYAEQLNVSGKTLNSVIKRSTGNTTIDYINSRIILEAKSKLRNPGIYIKEIANSLGFSDTFYFSRLFKKKCGCSPEKYREQFTQ
jgi:AraC-like DNA-binding protein